MVPYTSIVAQFADMRRVWEAVGGRSPSVAPGLPPLSGSASPVVFLLGSKVGNLQDHHNDIALAWGNGETSD